MAVQAIIGYRGMFKEERTSFFRMALKTGLIHIISFQQAIRITAMGVMAVSA
jgi:hypothetical protein